MKTCIALLRGINVGGNSSLPMKALVALLEEMGAQDVKTVIQSGNAVFRSTAPDRAQFAARLAGEIRARHGFAPHVLILGAEALEAAIAGNPFPEAESAPATLHLGFLDSAPQHPDLQKLDSLRKPSERFHLAGAVFYLHAPEGVGRSKLAAGAEKALGVAMTDRNWNTVCRLQELARGASA